MERLEEKLDKMSDKLDQQGLRLTTIEVDLRYHIKRTDTLEDMVKRHEKYFWMAVGVSAVTGPLINLLLQKLVQ